jgi:hypothetical protein
MTLADDDHRLLGELCEQHGVSTDKVLKLLETVRDYELMDRRYRLESWQVVARSENKTEEFVKFEAEAFYKSYS